MTALTTTLAASWMALASMASPGDSSEMRVVVLPLQSYEVQSEPLDRLTRHLRRRVAEDAGLRIVDPIPLLIDAGSDQWLHADKLLFDGMQDYNNLDYASAVTKLRKAAEISERSFRDLADVHGKRRMREIYLYLGLSRLEQGEPSEADLWFLQAAQVDPTFEPDALNYSPAARKAYAAAREKLAGAPPLTRDRLSTVCALAKADVILAGGVTLSSASADPGMGVELVVYQREGGLLRAQRLTLSGGETDIEVTEVALDENLPPLLAALAGRPWPEPTPPSRLGGQLTAEYTGGLMPEADILLKVRNQQFRYEGPVTQHGIGLRVVPWQHGGWSAEARLAFYAPRALPGTGGLPSATNPRGSLPFSATLGGELTRTWFVGDWQLGAGAGLGVRQLVGTFNSDISLKTDAWTWFYPSASAVVRRDLSKRSYTYMRVGAEYDVFSAGVAPFTLTWSAGAGIGF